MKQVLVLVVLAVLMNGEAKAQPTYHFLGVGTLSCGTWTAARRSGGSQALANEQWTLGFLSGVGAEGTQLGADPLNNADADGVWAWIDDYCHAHPVETIARAAKAFSIEHPR